MMATFRDELNMEQITPYSKTKYYSDIPRGGT